MLLHHSLQPEADRNSVIYLLHLFFIQMTHMFPQAPFVNGADLFQQDHRILA